MKSIDKKKIMILIFIIVFSVIYLLPKKEPEYIESNKYIVNPRTKTSKNYMKIAIPAKNDISSIFSDGDDSVSLLSRLVNPSLFYKDKNNKVKLDLAEKYWYEDDGATISVVIRDDVTFPDGKKLTVDNILNTFKLLSDPSYNMGNSSFMENLKGYFQYKINLSQDFPGIEVFGDKFIKFHFNDSSFTNINSLLYPILNISSDDYKYNQLGNINERKLLQGAGRYQVKHVGQDNIQLELRNQESNKDVKVKNIELYKMDYQSALRSFRNGDIDLVYKYPKHHTKSQELKNRTKEYALEIDNQSANYHVLEFGATSKIFSKAELRRAFRNAIDFKKIVEEIFGNEIYDFQKLPVYQNSWFYDENFDFNKNENFGQELDKFFDKRGKKYIDGQSKDLRAKLVYYEKDSFAKKISQAIRENISKYGLDIEIVPLDSKTMLKLSKGQVDYDILISQRKMLEMPVQKHEDNYKLEGGTITNAEESSFLYLLEKIKTDTDDLQIKYMAEKWKKQFDETCPYIVIATNKTSSLVNKRVENIYLNEFVGFENIENLVNIHFRD